MPHEPEKIRDCYTRSLNSTLHIVEAVADSQWTNATPCGEWDVKGIVNHLVYENRWMVALFNGKTIDEVDQAFEGDLVGGDPLAAFQETSDEVLKILAQDDAMSRTCHISSGPTSGAEYASQLFLDSLIHGWDISVGIGSPASLDSELVGACLPLAELTAKYATGSGSFAEPVQVNADASQQTRLLAILGRVS